MTCFHSVYKCIQRLGPRDSLGHELRAVQGLMVLVVAEGSPVAPVGAGVGRF